VQQLGQKQEAYKTFTKEQQRFWKRILIVDDNEDVTLAFKVGLEDSNNSVNVNKRIGSQKYIHLIILP